MTNFKKSLKIALFSAFLSTGLSAMEKHIPHDVVVITQDIECDETQFHNEEELKNIVIESEFNQSNFPIEADVTRISENAIPVCDETQFPEINNN